MKVLPATACGRLPESAHSSSLVVKHIGFSPTWEAQISGSATEGQGSARTQEGFWGFEDAETSMKSEDYPEAEPESFSELAGSGLSTAPPCSESQFTEAGADKDSKVKLTADDAFLSLSSSVCRSLLCLSGTG